MPSKGTVQWLRRIGVAAALVAPIAVVLVVAWPPDVEGIEAIGGADDGGPLAVGDELEGQVGFRGRVTYELEGAGEPVTVGVRGDGIDTTLTALRPNGEQVDHIDDVNGLDPELTLVPEAGEVVLFVVRELSGRPGSFTIYAEAAVAPGEEIDGGEVAAGAAVEQELARSGVVAFRVVGTGGEVTVGVEARRDGMDPTLTVLGADGGQLAFDDDSHGLDPEVTIDLREGEVVRVEVRELAGRPGPFELYVDEGPVGRRGPGGGGFGRPGGGVGPGGTVVDVGPDPGGAPATPAPPPALPPETTVPAEG